MGYRIRFATQDDIADITALFYVADGRHQRSLAYYKYSNFSPFGESIRSVAEKEGRIIGHYAVAPLKMKFLGEITNVGFAQQAVIHPDHRNLRTIKELHDMVIKESSKRFKFVIAFSNDNFAEVKKSLFNWRQLDRFPADVLHLTNLQRAAKYQLREIRRFEEDFVEENSLLRTKQYLNHRFFAHPINFYKCFGAYVKDRCMGYISIKFYMKNGELIGHFIDYVAKDVTALKSLVGAACDYFKFYGVKKIVFWNRDKWQVELAKLVVMQDFYTNFLVYNLCNDGRINNFKNYKLSMMLSDAF